MKDIIRRILQILCPQEEIHYVNGADTLPPPLSTEEEMEIRHNMQNDESLRQILVERNLRLVVYIAKKFENTNIDLEDLISIGTIGLIKAISSFSPERGTRLATYTARCIENAILS